MKSAVNILFYYFINHFALNWNFKHNMPMTCWSLNTVIIFMTLMKVIHCDLQEAPSIVSSSASVFLKPAPRPDSTSTTSYRTIRAGGRPNGWQNTCRVRGYRVSVVSSRLSGPSLWFSCFFNPRPGQADRKHCKFKPDPKIPELFTARNEDYLRSGWSRGHMAPAGDNKISEVQHILSLFKQDMDIEGQITPN